VTLLLEGPYSHDGDLKESYINSNPLLPRCELHLHAIHAGTCISTQSPTPLVVWGCIWGVRSGDLEAQQASQRLSHAFASNRRVVMNRAVLQFFRATKGREEKSVIRARSNEAKNRTWFV